MNLVWSTLIALSACAPSPSDLSDSDSDGEWADPSAPWTSELPGLDGLLPPVRGRAWRRAVVHVHTPYSHDACDGDGYVDGSVDAACYDDLEAALCALHYDAAYVTDHPAHATEVSADRQLRATASHAVLDTPDTYAVSKPCPDGHVVHWFVGFENDLMPIGLSKDIPTDALHGTEAAKVEALQDAGGHVLIAHTEGRDPADLTTLQDRGLHGLEAYNVHAMFGPDIRRDDLGLDSLGFTAAIGPFLDPVFPAQPDLLFLGVHQHQRPSLDRWDALLARGPMMATAGNDAHQNVVPAILSDGERVDSYRRALRWAVTWLLADDATPQALEDAVARRASMVVFEVLGTPAGFDVHGTGGPAVVEQGDSGPGSTLVVACPTLAAGTPRGPDEPEITVQILRDGVPWQTGCGTFEAPPGAYRVEVEITPHHLGPFLEGAEALIQPLPWIYSGAVRLTGP